MYYNRSESKERIIALNGSGLFLKEQKLLKFYESVIGMIRCHHNQMLSLALGHLLYHLGEFQVFLPLCSSHLLL